MHNRVRNVHQPAAEWVWSAGEWLRRSAAAAPAVTRVVSKHAPNMQIQCTSKDHCKGHYYAAAPPLENLQTGKPWLHENGALIAQPPAVYRPSGQLVHRRECHYIGSKRPQQRDVPHRCYAARSTL
jgi:hypothetical protein